MKEYLIQIIAVLIANFIVKPNGYREHHENIIFISAIRAITFFLITLILHQFNDIYCWSVFPALAVFVANVFMDNKSKDNITWFTFNQSIQILFVIIPFIIRDYNFINLEGLQKGLTWDKTTYLVILSYILCTSPSNILIRIILDKYLSNNNESQLKAGRLIGSIERILTISLLYADQYEAIGFLIAAKSIIRTKEESNGQDNSEYILIGTLLSFGLAIGMGLIVDNI